MLVRQLTSMHDAAHVVVAAGADFDAVVHQVEAVFAAAVDHAGEMFGHVLDVGRVEEDAAAGRAAAGHDFHVAAAADDVARGAFEFVGGVALHVALAEGVVELGAGAAESFFQQAAGGDRVAGEDAGGVELHHLHVDELGAESGGHGLAVGGFFQRRRADVVHRGAGAGGGERGLGRDGDEAAAAVVEQHGADDARAGREEIEAAGFFEDRDVRLLEDPVAEVRHDLDAGEVAFVDGAVEALAGERFLVDRAVGVAVEEAADAVFELDDAVGRIVHECPGELLVVEELAAADRVVEVFVEGVGRVEDAVVSALDHARAAGSGR